MGPYFQELSFCGSMERTQWPTNATCLSRGMDDQSKFRGPYFLNAFIQWPCPNLRAVRMSGYIGYYTDEMTWFSWLFLMINSSILLGTCTYTFNVHIKRYGAVNYNWQYILTMTVLEIICNGWHFHFALYNEHVYTTVTALLTILYSNIQGGN